MTTGTEVEFKVTTPPSALDGTEEAQVEIWFPTIRGGKRLAAEFPIILDEAAVLCNALFQHFGEQLLDQIEGRFMNPLLDVPEVIDPVTIEAWQADENWRDMYAAEHGGRRPPA